MAILCNFCLELMFGNPVLQDAPGLSENLEPMQENKGFLQRRTPCAGGSPPQRRREWRSVFFEDMRLRKNTAQPANMHARAAYSSTAPRAAEETCLA